MKSRLKYLWALLQVGVYLGVCGSEVHALWLGDVRNITGYEQTGCTMSMMANRLSFFYGFKGPSKAVDTGEIPTLCVEKLLSQKLDFQRRHCSQCLSLFKVQLE